MVGIGNCNECCEVKNHIAAFHGFLYTVGITDITRENFDVFGYFFWRFIKPTPGIKGVVQDESPNRVALTYKVFDKVRANESVSPGNQYLFPGKVHEYVAYW